MKNALSLARAFLPDAAYAQVPAPSGAASYDYETYADHDCEYLRIQKRALIAKLAAAGFLAPLEAALCAAGLTQAEFEILVFTECGIGGPGAWEYISTLFELANVMRELQKCPSVADSDGGTTGTGGSDTIGLGAGSMDYLVNYFIDHYATSSWCSLDGTMCVYLAS